MNWTLNLIAIILFSISIISFLMTRQHILIALMAIELAMMTIMFLSITSTQPLLMINSPFIIILTLSVCEASLGLALLVTLIRTAGNDHVNLTSLAKL